MKKDGSKLKVERAKLDEKTNKLIDNWKKTSFSNQTRINFCQSWKPVPRRVNNCLCDSPNSSRVDAFGI